MSGRKWAISWQNLSLPYENNKAVNQPAHLDSLFVICGPLGSNHIQNSKTLDGLCSWTGWFKYHQDLYLHKQIFHDMAQKRAFFLESTFSLTSVCKMCRRNIFMNKCHKNMFYIIMSCEITFCMLTLIKITRTRQLRSNFSFLGLKGLCCVYHYLP